jgi:hypothetical protein
VRRRVRHSIAPGLRPGPIPRRSRQAASVVGGGQARETARPAGGDEDRNLARAGSLERGKPILLRVDTLRHAGQGRFGASVPQVRERRPYDGYGHGRRGEDPREVKTQERIGSNLPGNTWRLVARTLTWLKPLKTSPPRPVRGTRVDGCGRRHRVPRTYGDRKEVIGTSCDGPGCRFRGAPLDLRARRNTGSRVRDLEGPGHRRCSQRRARTPTDAAAGLPIGMALTGAAARSDLRVRPEAADSPDPVWGRWQRRHRRYVPDPCQRGPTRHRRLAVAAGGRSPGNRSPGNVRRGRRTERSGRLRGRSKPLKGEAQGCHRRETKPEG